MPLPQRCIFDQVIFDEIWSPCDPDLWSQNLISSRCLHLQLRRNFVRYRVYSPLAYDHTHDSITRQPEHSMLSAAKCQQRHKKAQSQMHNGDISHNHSQGSTMGGTADQEVSSEQSPWKSAHCLGIRHGNSHICLQTCRSASLHSLGPRQFPWPSRNGVTEAPMPSVAMRSAPIQLLDHSITLFQLVSLCFLAPHDWTARNICNEVHCVHSAHENSLPIRTRAHYMPHDHS